MQSKDFKKDLKGIQNKLMGATAAPSWTLLKSRIMEFMNETRRTWGSAVFYLLEKGLEYERNGKSSEGR